MSVLDSFYTGDIRALSRIISHVENRLEGHRKLLSRLYSRSGKGVRVGITGPPGAGKSTLVNGLAKRFLGAGNRVGVIAVDPTSPFTGGALLGDRVRLGNFPTDGTFYFRSMATRGATGGLADATDNVTVILDAFGFDIALVETVGVGQVELDIIDTCDSSVVVIVPESGDSVQTMKAGLSEIADIFCVNKSDRQGAVQLASNLEQAIMLRGHSDQGWQVPVIATEAIHDKNLDNLYDSILRHLEYLRESNRLATHRREQIIKKILHIIHSQFQMDLMVRLNHKLDAESLADRVLAGESDPYDIAADLYEQYRRE